MESKRSTKKMATDAVESQVTEGCDEIQKFIENYKVDAKVEEENQSNDKDGETEALDDNDLGTYFIDEDGQLYFQPAAKDDRTASDKDANDNTSVSESVNPTADEDKTVENGNDEISYVYIVEEGEEEKPKEENDITVYDFNDEGEDSAEGNDSDYPGEKKKKVNKSRMVHYCPHCDYSNSKKAALIKHMKVHSDNKPYKCSVCGRGFRSQASLVNHENIHTGTKPYHCKACDCRFTTAGEIVRHIRYRHSKVRPHKCNECDYAAVELSKLRRHQRSHTGERPYQCPHCTYASPDTFKLKRHIRIHTGERPYKCDICEAAFSQSNSLKAHRLTHFPESRPSYQCAICPVVCSRKADLRSHINKLHSTTKPYECKRCGKILPDRYTYKMHSRTHNGEKAFKCHICPYASVYKVHLESHMFIHTNEKPYKCDMCDYRSRQKQLLKRHKNFYHTPGYVRPESNPASHECEECHKKFIHIGNLIKHLAVHDPESNVHEMKNALKIGRKKRIRHTSVEDDDEVELSMVRKVDDFGEDEPHIVVFEMMDDEGGEKEEKSDSPPRSKIAKVNPKEDMKNCFGFMEEDGEDDDDDED